MNEECFITHFLIKKKHLYNYFYFNEMNRFSPVTEGIRDVRIYSGTGTKRTYESFYWKHIFEKDGVLYIPLFKNQTVNDTYIETENTFKIIINENGVNDYYFYNKQYSYKLAWELSQVNKRLTKENLIGTNFMLSIPSKMEKINEERIVKIKYDIEFQCTNNLLSCQKIKF